jgi:hypothetical protein
MMDEKLQQVDFLGDTGKGIALMPYAKANLKDGAVWVVPEGFPRPATGWYCPLMLFSYTGCCNHINTFKKFPINPKGGIFNER